MAGNENTLTALQAGQVSSLIMTDDFAAPGWADFHLPLYGAGDSMRTHPAGSDPANLVPVALEDEMIRLALRTGATVQIVRSAAPVVVLEEEAIPSPGTPMPRSAAATVLDDLSGVGALLRFSVDQDTSTAQR